MTEWMCMMCGEGGGRSAEGMCGVLACIVWIESGGLVRATGSESGELRSGGAEPGS